MILIAQAPTIELEVISQDASATTMKLLVGFKRYPTKIGKLKIDAYQAIVEAPEFDILNSTELDTFIKAEIVYIKNIALATSNVEGKVSHIKIKDTRTAAPLTPTWGNPKECLKVVLAAYFEWSSWKVPFISAVQSALLDTNFLEEGRKNLPR